MPNHVENDLYISGPSDQVDALLDFIGANESPPQFDFRCIIPYPEPWASMDAEHSAIKQAGREAGESAVGGALRCSDPESQAKRPVYFQASEAVQRPLMEAYKAKWGTTSDGYNSGGYEWCCKIWGTKWGAYDVARRDYDGSIILTFQSAWSPPSDAIFAELQKRFPGVTLTLEYFERGMGFCGGATWPAEDDYYEDGKPWYAGIKISEWHSEEYKGKRGG